MRNLFACQCLLTTALAGCQQTRQRQLDAEVLWTPDIREHELIYRRSS